MSGMMSLMQFQRQLEEREIPKQTAYMLATMYEQLLEVSKQLDQCTTIMLATVETMDKVVGSNELVLRQARALRAQGKEDGIDVRSVVNDPEDRDN